MLTSLTKHFPKFHVSTFVASCLVIPNAWAQADDLQPVCQLNLPSGFCQPPSPSSNLVRLSAPTNNQAFGTFGRPFAVDSLWNSRPQVVTFGNAVIPPSTYFPLVGTGSYSTTAFLASKEDPPMTVYPAAGKNGVWDPDSETSFPSITIPHWPSETVPATGTDGHADIVDVDKGIIHSFFQLRRVNGRWTATQYAWAPLDGRGWGNGGHYFQGARAAGTTSMAGIIRKHEINDGANQYHHALAMSLTYNAMSNKEQYVYPATSGDRTWNENYGHIPMGALMMLPPTFDPASIANPALRKVVNTLKTYGAYVIDRNVGTPFYIYVENGSDFNLHRGGWDNVVAKDLHRIREALRVVTHASNWVNGRGEPIASMPGLNMISMRGPWRAWQKSTTLPVFDSKLQQVVFGKTTKVQRSENASGRIMAGVNWAKPIPGKLYEFRVEATNGGKAYLRYWGGGKEQFNTRPLGNGQSVRLVWPNVAGTPILGVESGVGSSTNIRGVLVPVK